MLAGKGFFDQVKESLPVKDFLMPHHPLTNFEIQKYFKILSKKT